MFHITGTIIAEVVQRNFKDATVHLIEMAAKEWLRTAADRDGGRKRRSSATDATLRVQAPTEQQATNVTSENTDSE